MCRRTKVSGSADVLAGLSVVVMRTLSALCGAFIVERENYSKTRVQSPKSKSHSGLWRLLGGRGLVAVSPLPTAVNRFGFGCISLEQRLMVELCCFLRTR